MNGTTHPDYFQTPEARRWDAELAKLISVLKREAKAAGIRWAWRMLPQGVVVALRYRGDGWAELRFARRGIESGETWDREVGALLRALGCERWDPVLGVEADPDRAVALFVEPPVGISAPMPDLFGVPTPKPPNAIAQGR